MLAYTVLLCFSIVLIINILTGIFAQSISNFLSPTEMPYFTTMLMGYPFLNLTYRMMLNLERAENKNFIESICIISRSGAKILLYAMVNLVKAAYN